MPATTTITVRMSPRLASTLDTLATRLSTAGGATAPGGRVTRTAAARLALQRGIGALEADLGAPNHLGTQLTPLRLPDPRSIEDATEAIELLADLELGRLDPEAIGALADLDVDVLRSLRRLDAEAIEALAALDSCSIDALGRLASGPLLDLLDRLEDLA